MSDLYETPCLFKLRSKLLLGFTHCFLHGYPASNKLDAKCKVIAHALRFCLQGRCSKEVEEDMTMYSVTGDHSSFLVSYLHDDKEQEIEIQQFRRCSPDDDDIPGIRSYHFPGAPVRILDSDNILEITEKLEAFFPEYAV